MNLVVIYIINKAAQGLEMRRCAVRLKKSKRKTKTIQLCLLANGLTPGVNDYTSRISDIYRKT